MLLFHTQDPVHPSLGRWWELPGGGIDPGESYLDAAIRELHEKTGIVADPSQVRARTWRRRASLRHRRTIRTLVIDHTTIANLRPTG
ncbi:MAG: NUDIX domain-containing protein [Nakamurella sp.]